MAIRKTQAIVLRRFPIRETSIVAVFLTPDFGRLHGILKGIRANPKKFASMVDILTLNEIVFYESRSSSLHLVSQATLIDYLVGHPASSQAIAMGGHALKIAELLSSEMEPNPELFFLLKDILTKISASDSPQHILRMFELKALDAAGVRPNITHCVKCDISDDARFFFSRSEGGLVCARCSTGVRDISPISPESLNAMRYMLVSKGPIALRVRLSRAAANEIDDIIRCFFAYHIDKDLKRSWRAEYECA